MTRSPLLLVSLLSASLAGCSASTADMHGGRMGESTAHSLGAIIGTVERLIDSDNARDLDAVLSCYTDDVTWLPPGEPPVSGKDAVRARYESLFAAYTLDFAVEIMEASGSGSVGFAWGYTRGSITPADGGVAVPVNDKFLAVLREDRGTWRVARLAWSPVQHAP